jgi:hypothetical protein
LKRISLMIRNPCQSAAWYKFTMWWYKKECWGYLVAIRRQSTLINIHQTNRRSLQIIITQIPIIASRYNSHTEFITQIPIIASRYKSHTEFTILFRGRSSVIMPVIIPNWL